MEDYFANLVKARRTTYVFTEVYVKDDLINTILETARWTPSSHNTQPWSFIVIKNQKKIKQLIDICEYGEYHSTPNTIIAVVLEPIYISEGGYRAGPGKKFSDYHKFLNIGLVVGNIVNQATELGIHSCILSPEIKKSNKILNVTGKREALILVGLGYERPMAFEKKQERKELSNLVFYEEYGLKQKPKYPESGD